MFSAAECFNSPYGTGYFKEYAEPVPGGPSCQALQAAARENKVRQFSVDVGNQLELVRCDGTSSVCET